MADFMVRRGCGIGGGMPEEHGEDAARKCLEIDLLIGHKRVKAKLHAGLVHREDLQVESRWNEAR